MDSFKIELFRDSYNIPFPEFVTLNIDECYLIRERINQILQIDKLVDPIDTVIKLSNSQQSIDEINAKENDFSLLSQFANLEIIPQNEIYLNWHRFDEIDKFSRETIIQYFHDIWFPGSDDIDIFDSSLLWILSVRHDGNISILK